MITWNIDPTNYTQEQLEELLSVRLKKITVNGKSFTLIDSELANDEWIEAWI